MIHWKPRLVFYAIFITLFVIVMCAIDYFFKISLQSTSFFIGIIWGKVSDFINEITRSK